MDAVFVLFMVLIGLMVLMWTLSLLARRQKTIATTLPPERAVEVCDSRFSRVGWRRVDGDGTLNYSPRGFEFRGAKPPTLSINVFPDDESDLTFVGMWLSQWTTQYGMISHVEKVFWKRWTLPKALRNAEQAANPVPLAPQPTAAAQPMAAAPNPLTAQASAGSDKPASTDLQVPLVNPGLPDDDAKQLAYRMFHACGLTLLSWGPRPLDEHVQGLLATAPAFRDTELSDAGAAELPGVEGMWLGFEGPAGSMIAFFVTGGEGQGIIDNLLKPIQRMPAEWNWAISTAGGEVPSGVATIFAGAQMVPLWQLSSFSGQAPAESVQVSPELGARLTATGWNQIDDHVYRQDLSVTGGGLQTMVFGPHGPGTLALLAPIGGAVDGAIPPQYRSRSYGRYRLDLASDIVVLYLPFPAETVEPTAETVNAEANQLADYAFRQADEIANSAPTVSFSEPTHAYSEVPEPPTTAIPPVSPFAHTQAAQTPLPIGGDAPAEAPPSRTPTSRNPMLIAGAVVAVGIVAAAAIFALTGSDESPRNTAASGPNAAPAAVDEVSPCDVAPLLQPETVRFTNSGLMISTHITPGCDNGDLLANRGFRVAVVDGAGNNVASGVFDLGSTPIAVGSGGTTVDFTFPAGTYWRTADAISGDLELIPHRDGYDTTPGSSMRSATAVTADKAGAPESGDLETAAQSALDDIAAADRSVIDSTLLDMWQPQLSSKRPGLFADGITWTNPEILREHLAFREQYPSARLLWSGDWPVYSDRTWWVTVSGVPFNTGEQALGWCVDHNYDWEHCFAKMLSHTKGSDGTTLLQKR
ncbi:hypothetical protein SAMN04489835_0140 [Mycolicibacterium rutilum]|uniref:Uncharacterized protein n=1 Tax=Mycolicibacterium rutilum TaxID=370526 RepID=A0A1H6IK34_MYCRU|nr:hypothetical protein [Mycolicibacterium rutilum]SEH46757.1 hypothetical protein SAMN04489835_0140 [Mycolicibacterium rutilum]